MIDAHAHAHLPRVPQPGECSDVALARQMGVDRIVLIGEPETVGIARDRHPDFIIPVGQFDMNRQRPAGIRHWLPQLAGIKFTMPEEPYSARRYWPLYDLCVEAKLPTIFHCGYLGRYGPESLRVRMTDTRPAELDCIARNWPDLTIVMAHFGNPWWDEAFKVLWANPNVYADLSGGSCYRRGIDEWRRLFSQAPEVARRLLFGSDKTYWRDATARLPEYIGFYSALTAALNLSIEDCRLIWRGNAARIFKVTE